MRNNTNLFLLLLSLSIFFFISNSSKAYSGDHVVDFDIQAFVDKAVENGQNRIVIPPGVYRVTPKHREHLVLKDLSDIEIIASDVEMICTETTRALTIYNCKNLRLSGMTIDYDPLPFTQGRITALAEDKSWIEFEIIDGYPENLEMRIEIFDAKTELLKRETYYGWQDFESLSNRKYRVKKADVYRYSESWDKEEIGDILVTNSSTAPNGSIPHAILCENNVNVELIDISLFASNCFGFLEVNCDASKYIKCKIDRRPLENDIKPRGLHRLRSLDADAYHSKHARKGPEIIQCTAKYQGDDCVNICGDYHMVMASDGAKLRVLAKHDFNIEPGDPLEVVTYDGRRLKDMRAVSKKSLGNITDSELEFLSKQRMDVGLKRGASKNVYELVVDNSVDLPMGSVIAAANKMGNGFKVSECDFGYNRSRGILIKASDGTVSKNQIVGSWGESIKISPEYWWLESGSSNNIRVIGNTIGDCGGDGIAIYANAGSGEIAPAGAHNKIVVSGNTITNVKHIDIRVTSTKGLLLRSNSFGDETPNVKLEKCTQVKSDIPKDEIDAIDVTDFN